MCHGEVLGNRNRATNHTLHFVLIFSLLQDVFVSGEV